jgi:hypothetical protein
MKKRNIKWLRQRFAKKLSSKVRVLEEIATYLMDQGREDLLAKVARAGGDGVQITGTIRYDNFEGAWGDQKELNRRYVSPAGPRRCL